MNVVEVNRPLKPGKSRFGRHSRKRKSPLPLSGDTDGKYFAAISRDSFGQTLDNSTDTNYDYFTGKPKVEGLGYAFLFRNYAAGLGKWTTSDPLGYPDDWNNFAYVNNWVNMAVDPLGLAEEYAGTTPSVFNSSSFYVMGRDEMPILNPQNPIMNFIEDYFPYAHYFAVVHDDWVDSLTSWGVPDWLANIPTMPAAYVYAFSETSYSQFQDLLNYAGSILGLTPTAIPHSVTE
jgi:RHS repeat-associated protein